MLKPFPTANWRYLAMLNFAVDAEFLAPHVPAGTQLDFYKDKTYLGALYSDRSRPTSARRKSDTDRT